MRRRPAGRGVLQQARSQHPRFLRHQDDPRRRSHRSLAAVGFRLTRQDAQQGRLARTVAADQAGAGARFKPQVHAVEQLDWPVPQPGVLERDDRWAAHRWAGLSGGAFFDSWASSAARANSADRVW